MNILEKEIEEIIFSYLKEKPLELFDRGFPFVQTCSVLRQFNLGGYGIIDICTFSVDDREKDFHVAIIEIKRGDLDFDSFKQIKRYEKGIKHLLSRSIYKDYNFIFSNFLVGKNLCSKDNFDIISDIVDVQCYTYSINMDKGLCFYENNSSLILSNPNFTDKSSIEIYSMKLQKNDFVNKDGELITDKIIK